MLPVAPNDNNRWVYAMHGLEKPNDLISAGGVMAGSVATLAVLWVSLQTMGFLGSTHNIAADKLPLPLQNYLAGYTGLPSSDYRNAIVIDAGEFIDRRLPPVDEKVLNASVNFGNTIVARLARLESNIAGAGVGITMDSPFHNQYLNSYPTEDALEKGADAMVALKASVYLVQNHCQRYGLNDVECAQFVSTLKLERTSLGPICHAGQHVACNPRAKYRSIDGACNNLENPRMGSALTAYTRILFPSYSDGIQAPRHAERERKQLPNARSVSASLSTPSEQGDVSRTLAVMEWSQFIAHDLSYTPVRKMMTTGKPILCCREDGSKLAPRYLHPDCSPIAVSDQDPIYGKHFVRCMNYVRSLPVLRLDCSFGPIEQMNQVSHFLDGSTIYGSTLKKSRMMRTFEGGRLRVVVRKGRQYLPDARSEPESLCQATDGCYESGDDRVNNEPHLAVMHTIWHREHNRIAKQLARLNPQWTDELLYQEARRIVVAEIQHITYNSWLPMLVGRKYVRSSGLLAGNSYSRNYHSDDDAAVSNEVATAALRFLNSLKQGKLSMTDESRMYNESLELSDHFYKPRVIETNDVFDGLLRGLTTQNAQKMDLHVTPAMSHQLYKTNGELGMDVVSLDIQRGRDHGLPGYNHYRKYCGLSEAKTFDDFLDYIPLETVKKLRSLYNHPNDVDLVVGGMSERAAEGGILGPTFRCLLSDQFSRTRRTDRFFYDLVTQTHPFTPEQLIEIRKASLSRIFCDNGDDIRRMQPNAFVRPQAGNELRSCDDFEAIPSVDLFAWAEKSKAYR